MSFDLILDDGNVFLYGGVKRTSIGIENGKIVAIGNISEFNGNTKRINLSGKLVMPGGVDPHTHIEGYSSTGPCSMWYSR